MVGHGIVHYPGHQLNSIARDVAVVWLEEVEGGERTADDHAECTQYPPSACQYRFAISLVDSRRRDGIKGYGQRSVF